MDSNSNIVSRGPVTDRLRCVVCEIQSSFNQWDGCGRRSHNNHTGYYWPIPLIVTTRRNYVCALPMVDPKAMITTSALIFFCFPRSFYEDASRMLISANCFNKNNAQTVAKVMWKGFCFFVCFCTKYFLLFESNTFVFTRMHNVVCVYIYIVNLIKSCVPFVIFFFFEGFRARACAWVNKICSPLSFIFIKIRLSGVLWTLWSGFHNYCLLKSQLFAG